MVVNRHARGILLIIFDDAADLRTRAVFQK